MGFAGDRRSPSDSATGCCRSTVRPFITRRTWARWSPSTPRPERCAGSPPIPGWIGRDRRKRPRPEPGGRTRRTGDRRSRRCRRDLRVRCRQRPAGLEDRPHSRGGPARSSAGRRQGAAGRHRRSGVALRRQDRQAGGHLARRGQSRRLRPRPAGGRQDLLADRDRDPGPRPGDRPAADPPIKLMEIFRTTGRQPRGRRRLPDRRPARCPGRLLPEQPADRAVSRRDRAQPRIRRRTHYRLAQAAEAVGRDQLALESYDQATRRARTGRDHRRRTPGRGGTRPRVPAAPAGGGGGPGRQEIRRGDQRAGDRLADRPIRWRPADGPGCCWPTSRCKPIGRPPRSIFSSKR